MKYFKEPLIIGPNDPAKQEIPAEEFNQLIDDFINTSDDLPPDARPAAKATILHYLNAKQPVVVGSVVLSVETQSSQVCRVCGCSNDDACFHEEVGNCWWVEEDLCSHCHLWPGEATRYSQLLK